MPKLNIGTQENRIPTVSKRHNFMPPTHRDFIKGQASGKLNICEHSFARSAFNIPTNSFKKDHSEVNYPTQVCTSQLPSCSNLINPCTHILIGVDVQNSHLNQFSIFCIVSSSSRDGFQIHQQQWRSGRF